MNIFKSLSLSFTLLYVYYIVKELVCDIYTANLLSKKLIYKKHRKAIIKNIKVKGFNKVELLVLDSGLAKIIKCTFSDLEEI